MPFRLKINHEESLKQDEITLNEYIIGKNNPTIPGQKTRFQSPKPRAALPTSTQQTKLQTENLYNNFLVQTPFQSPQPKGHKYTSSFSAAQINNNKNVTHNFNTTAYNTTSQQNQHLLESPGARVNQRLHNQKFSPVVPFNSNQQIHNLSGKFTSSDKEPDQITFAMSSNQVVNSQQSYDFEVSDTKKSPLTNSSLTRKEVSFANNMKQSEISGNENQQKPLIQEQQNRFLQQTFVESGQDNVIDKVEINDKLIDVHLPLPLTTPPSPPPIPPPPPRTEKTGKEMQNMNIYQGVPSPVLRTMREEFGVDQMVIPLTDGNLANFGRGPIKILPGNKSHKNRSFVETQASDNDSRKKTSNPVLVPSSALPRKLSVVRGDNNDNDNFQNNNFQHQQNSNSATGKILTSTPRQQQNLSQQQQFQHSMNQQAHLNSSHSSHHLPPSLKVSGPGGVRHSQASPGYSIKTSTPPVSQQSVLTIPMQTHAQQQFPQLRQTNFNPASQQMISNYQQHIFPPNQQQHLQQLFPHNLQQQQQQQIYQPQQQPQTMYQLSQQNVGMEIPFQTHSGNVLTGKVFFCFNFKFLLINAYSMLN